MNVFQLKLISKDWILFNYIDNLKQHDSNKIRRLNYYKQRKTTISKKKNNRQSCKEFEKIEEPIIIVHGGGSYGHYWSVKYDMHTKERKYDLERSINCKKLHD